MKDQEQQGGSKPQGDGAFETLLWELFLRFVDLPGDQVDDAIRDAQRQLCEAFELDRSTMWQAAGEDPVEMRVSHIYQRPQIEGRRALPVAVDERTGLAEIGSSRVVPFGEMRLYPAAEDARSTFPWITQRVLEGLTTAFSTLDELPSEAARDVDYLRQIGTLADVIVPLKADLNVLGCLTFASTTARCWTELMITRFELIAHVFAKALLAKQPRQLVRQNDARVSLAAASAGAGLWDLEISTGRIHATEVVKQFLGIAPDEEVTVETVLSVVHPDDLELYKARLAWFRDHGDSYSQEYRLLLPDGTIRWINSRGKSFATNPGEPPDRVFGVSIDVTERKRSEEALCHSEAVNRATFEQAAVGIAHVAADGSWVRVNDKLCDILGYSREELLGGMTVQDLTHPDDLKSDLESLRELTAGRRTTHSTEKRYVRRNRSVIWANMTVSLVKDEAGRPEHFISILEDISDRKRTEEQLQTALADLQRLRDQLQLENRSLRDEVQRRGGIAVVVGTSPRIRAALGLADQVASTGATVLLLGETGTGKERFANYIHEHGTRRGRTMVRVNCAAIPTTLIESELFGREKGAFTGALARQIGRFELANGSTIFLDEIGDLPLEVQVKLLRVLEERCVERLGNPRPVPVDVRIIAATHRDLERAVRERTFREDLYYRLNVFPIALPPLRDRLEDIPLLARAMTDELGRTMGRRFDPLSQGMLQALRQYQWPGNIRELRNVLERAMITSTTATLHVAVPATAPEPLVSPVDAQPRPCATGSALKDVERAHILEVLEKSGWRIRGPHGAAAILGLPPTTLENRMKRLGISRPRPIA
jgi:formate hydrogenlyase transcriptional activator